MKDIKIGDTLWHPCSVGIIEHKVTAIHQYEGFTHFTAKAVREVGACGKVQVVLDCHKGRLRFVELLDEDSLPTASGLQDFVEGDYYTDKDEARRVFYDQQETLCRRAVERLEADLKAAKANYERVSLLVKTIKEQIKERDEPTN